MNINLPWSIGDDCWAVYTRTIRSFNHCEHCNRTEKKEEYVRELRPGKIVTMDIFVRPGDDEGDDPTIITYYHCSFDGYSCNVGKKVWATKEEAELEFER